MSDRESTRIESVVAGAGAVGVLQESGGTSRRVLGVPEFARISDHAWISRVPDLLLMVMFVLGIGAPLVAFLLHWQSGQAMGENRALAKPPAFRHDATSELPAEIDAYYSDYFGFRKQLIRWQSILERKWLGISSDSVVIGKNRWLFLTDGGPLLEDFLGRSPFTTEELYAWKAYLETRHEELAHRGVRYLFVVAPDKWFIYPEMLPGPISSKAGHPRLDQLISFLKATHSPAEVVDLRPALIRAKPQGELFFRQDSHWNGRGYLVGYQEICKHLQKWFPEIQPQTVGKDYEIRPVLWGGGEWSSLGLQDENMTYVSFFAFAKGTQTSKKVSVKLPSGIIPTLPPQHMPIEMVQPGATHRLLVLHDSYLRAGFDGPTEIPFSQHFADTLYIGMTSLSLTELLDLVAHQHSDVVMEEMVQRHIRGAPEPQVVAVSPAAVNQSVTFSDRTSASVLDSINSVNAPISVSPIHLPADQDIVFAGWAVDEPNGKAAGGVDIVIDHATYHAVYGIEREDVAAHFKNPALHGSGFRLNLPPRTLAKGPHTVTVRPISSDQKVYYAGPTIRFSVD